MHLFQGPRGKGALHGTGSTNGLTQKHWLEMYVLLLDCCWKHATLML